MLLLRLVQGTRICLPWVLMASLIAEGMLAFVGMFTLPLVSLLLIYVAVCSIILYVGIRALLTKIERRLSNWLGLDPSQ